MIWAKRFIAVFILNVKFQYFIEGQVETINFKASRKQNFRTRFSAVYAKDQNNKKDEKEEKTKNN